MNRHVFIMAAALTMGMAGVTLAQPATVVQLPTYSFHSGATTLSVPDRGSALMNSIKRASTGRNEFGVPLLPFRPFHNSAFGTQRSLMSTHVTATIHDFEAMDKLLLGQTLLPGQTELLSPLEMGAPGQAATVARVGTNQPPRRIASSAARPVMSVAAARAARVEEQTSENGRQYQRMALFLRRAADAESAGRTSSAEAYYRLVARDATGELRQQALARLDTLLRSQADSGIARR